MHESKGRGIDKTIVSRIWIGVAIPPRLTFSPVRVRVDAVATGEVLVGAFPLPEIDGKGTEECMAPRGQVSIKTL